MTADSTLENDLRARLHAAAEHGAWHPGMGDDAAVDDVLERRRVQRRTRVAVLSAAACTALVVAMVPLLLGATGPAGQTATPSAVPPSSDGVTDESIQAQLPVDLLSAPTRGSLAGDAAYVEAVRTADWTDLSGGFAQVADRRVAFVGDVPGGRWALVVGQTGGRLAHQWFTGPPGAAAGELVADRSGVESEGDAFVYVLPTGSHQAPGSPPGAGTELTEVDELTVVVVAQPGDVVQVSDRVVVEADGAVSRDFVPAPGGDGVAVTQLPGTVLDTSEGSSSAVFRLVRDGTAGPVRTLGLSDPLVLTDPPPLDLRPLRPGSSDVSPDLVRFAAVEVARHVGLPADQLDPQVLWSGPVSAGDGQISVAMVALRMPSGALVVNTAYAVMTPGTSARDTPLSAVGGCGAETHAETAVVDDLAVLSRCSVPGDLGARETVYVGSAPPVAQEMRGAGTYGSDEASWVVRLDQGHGSLAGGEYDTASFIGPGYALLDQPVAVDPADVLLGGPR
ncbi:hypothetical protein GB931_00475 [Modestobacter sp. I12A-02628]|uniref:Uncharacterized protein n=1 Tax=Goekera deserti TaxID=2497753 RepID=A0A7K3WI93_9ACTN|nr:hypothetical protein [Goekera deserti]MPQ96422.1 hypothetical protein [Goekera deserti]NDI47266.1 hypothetical protein [Goekera deserti]NEL56096.1 hypothetical protein [Goekera deserti]